MSGDLWERTVVKLRAQLEDVSDGPGRSPEGGGKGEGGKGD
jgi:hypothetical protein